MPRYIDVDKLIGEMKSLCEQDRLEFMGVYDCIKSQHTADVMEVVRCKDCKYYKTKPLTGEKLCIKHKESMERMWRSKPDDYCSCGERKKNNENTNKKKAK